MVINENNSQINAFAKGMNSDTAYDMVDNQQYVFGKNVRITKNEFLGGGLSATNHSSLHEGAITPVPFGKEIHPINERNEIQQVKEDGKFLALDTIGNFSVIVRYDNTNQVLLVYRYTINEKDDTVSGGLFWVGKVKDASKVEQFKELEAVSTVLYQELENVIKLYIATGIYPIIEIRIDGEIDRYISNDYTTDINNGSYETVALNIDNFIHNKILPKKPVYIENKIDGQLKTSQIQYTYRFYNKFGTATQLAPLTNKIQVISPNRSTEVGNAQNTSTSIGFQIKILYEDEYKMYDRLQIYRLSYIVPGEDAKVELIFDGDVEFKNNQYFQFNDVGNIPLQELTMEEFAAMSGMIIIPKVIEQNQQYMFAANVLDDTIIENVSIDTTGSISLHNGIEIPIATHNSSYPIQNTDSYTDATVKNYFKDRNINPNLPKKSYNDIFTSSLLRSLRRGESYRYGIVYYDKYGRHTNVLKLGTVDVPEIYNRKITETVTSGINAKPIGVQIKIPTPTTKDESGNDIVIDDIVGCQIVRRSSKQIYQKTLLQVAISKPVLQDLYDVTITENSVPKSSPYYPTGYLLSGNISIEQGYIVRNNNIIGNARTKGKSLYMAMSNEFDFRRNDVISNLQANVLKVSPACRYSLDNGMSYQDVANNAGVDVAFLSPTSTTKVIMSMNQNSGKKATQQLLFPFYAYGTTLNAQQGLELDIKTVKDTKVAQWYDGFSNLQLDGTQIAAGGIKKYQSFTTNIDNNIYNNWVSSSQYDLRISKKDQQANLFGGDDSFFHALIAAGDKDTSLLSIFGQAVIEFWLHEHEHYGLSFIGPGPSCFLFTTKQDRELGTNYWDVTLCNIKHEAVQDAAEADEVVQYFGFGNYFPLEKVQTNNGNYYKVSGRDTNSNKDHTVYVYDGDIYITPHELVTMYKAYEFMSTDTLRSMQVVNYVPMESKVNTFFDYGMNYLNTTSTNLLSEPGSIDGVTTQERPIHQYNQIYSANDESNDVFTLVVEKSQDNHFKQRTYYSEPKTNGEYVDNFTVFKPAAYIDVDPNYGEITNLLTDKNTLYYWQDTAFGKFSVNERSLINDQNGNTIMLGQAGILSRNDYISTKYGMRLYDFCATTAENGVYWVDVNNKAIVGAAGNDVVNIGERFNVQNIINSKIYTYVPRVDYDLQNNELLCQCLTEGSTKWQLIFNLKLNVATSMYNRDYIDIASIKNHIYGYNTSENDVLFTKYNYLGSTNLFLKPLAVSLIVNPSASTTKVFDSQQLVPAKRIEWDGREILPKGNDLSDRLQFKNPGFWTTFFENTNASFSFETDINNTDNPIEAYTDREGNIIYNIPRYGKFDSVDENQQPIKINYNPRTQWGNRLRGKWMRVNFTAENPNEYTTISHVITKFRQSYS